MLLNNVKRRPFPQPNCKKKKLEGPLTFVLQKECRRSRRTEWAPRRGRRYFQKCPEFFSLFRSIFPHSAREGRRVLRFLKIIRKNFQKCLATLLKKGSSVAKNYKNCTFSLFFAARSFRFFLHDDRSVTFAKMFQHFHEYVIRFD